MILSIQLLMMPSQITKSSATKYQISLINNITNSKNYSKKNIDCELLYNLINIDLTYKVFWLKRIGVRRQYVIYQIYL